MRKEPEKKVEYNHKSASVRRGRISELVFLYKCSALGLQLPVLPLTTRLQDKSSQAHMNHHPEQRVFSEAINPGLLCRHNHISLISGYQPSLSSEDELDLKVIWKD